MTAYGPESLYFFFGCRYLLFLPCLTSPIIVIQQHNSNSHSLELDWVVSGYYFSPWRIRAVGREGGK